MGARRKPFSRFEHCPGYGGPVELSALVVLRTRAEDPPFVQRSCAKAGRCAIEHGDPAALDGCLLHGLG